MEAVLILIEHVWGSLRVSLLEVTFFHWGLWGKPIECSL